MADEIRIELHTDNNYVIPTVVMLTSLFKNKSKKSTYNVRVLGNNLTKENIDLIEKTCVKVIPHTTDLSYFEGKHEFVSSTDLFKFDLPDVLSDWDKVLYLDTDMIINSDLSELYNTDLGDNYVGAVKDAAALYFENHHTRLGIDSYFNAGMMLLNLKKMREDNIKEKLIDYKLNKDSGHFMSQDALNYVFANKVLWLHPRYNFMEPNLKSIPMDQLSFYFGICEKEFKRLYNKCTILHLTNKYKPWKYQHGCCADIWNKYFSQSACSNVKLELLPNPNNKFERNLCYYLKKITRFIFSVRNVEKVENIHKVVTVLGFKFKFIKSGSRLK